MYQSLLRDEKILAFLFRCDQDLAEELRREGCGCCGGRLHRADYLRKPRGLGAEAGPDLSVRFSFCCASEGCRKRSTPASLRFLGRKVYLAPAVVLGAVTGRGHSGRGIREQIGASRRTILRWRRWWRTTFAQSRFWQEARARLAVLLPPENLPEQLLDSFLGEPRDRLLALLRFLSPLTTASLGPAF